MEALESKGSEMENYTERVILGQRAVEVYVAAVHENVLAGNVASP